MNRRQAPTRSSNTANTPTVYANIPETPPPHHWPRPRGRTSRSPPQATQEHPTRTNQHQAPTRSSNPANTHTNPDQGQQEATPTSTITRLLSATPAGTGPPVEKEEGPTQTKRNTTSKPQTGKTGHTIPQEADQNGHPIKMGKPPHTAATRAEPAGNSPPHGHTNHKRLSPQNSAHHANDRQQTTTATRQTHINQSHSPTAETPTARHWEEHHHGAAQRR